MTIVNIVITGRIHLYILADLALFDPGLEALEPGLEPLEPGLEPPFLDCEGDLEPDREPFLELVGVGLRLLAPFLDVGGEGDRSFLLFPDFGEPWEETNRKGQHKQNCTVKNLDIFIYKIHTYLV